MGIRDLGMSMTREVVGGGGGGATIAYDVGKGVSADGDNSVTRRGFTVWRNAYNLVKHP